MEPNTPPKPQPEHVSAPQSPEKAQAPELTPAAPAETAPQAPLDPAAVVLPADPVAVPVAADPSAAIDPVAETPAIADDVDVIEKEWVDKAQDVIAKTKDDPYQEEEQIEQLQHDYLKKRYGKEIGEADGGA